MTVVSTFFQSHMILVFFVYGLSFFTLGAAVLFQTRKGSGFRIGHCLWLLAMFGLIYALNEWLDMFLLLGDSHWTSSAVNGIKVSRFFIGQISYVFLFHFGATVLARDGARSARWPRVLLVTYSAIMVGLFIWGCRERFEGGWFLASDLAMRYGLAFPGSLLTALAFLSTRRQPEIQALHAPRVSRGLLGLAILFAVYAVAAGLIVKRAPFFPATVFNYDSFIRVTGVPVQVLRAACAIGMAIAICQVLDIFELEDRNRMNLACRAILQISNSERARIGHDLHDGLGQEMTGIAYMTKALEADLAARAPDAAEAVRRLRSMLDACIDTVRTLARGLYPVAIEKNGLMFALQEFVASAERLYRIACTLEADEALMIDDNATAVHLFRIAQEAVANAVRHGQASELKIRLVRQAGRLVLSIEDDGRGIPEQSDRKEGMGLQIMRYRAGVIGANLEVQRCPQGGTMVRCQLDQGRLPIAG